MLMCLVIFSGILTVVGGQMQSKLLKDVFDGYQPALKPRCGANGTTIVDMDIGFRQILDLDEPKQLINCIIWIRLTWNDCRLTWNATLYDDIASLTLPHEKAWIPDITLYDSAKNTLSGIDLEYKLIVRHDGTVKYNFPSIIKSICPVDVTHFPFDYQVCTLTFGSWVYSLGQLDIRNTSEGPDTSAYIGNGEWSLVGTQVTRNTPGFGAEKFAMIKFVIQLQRRPLFYVLNLLFPCMLITLVAIMGFLLPAVSGEKVHIEITLMVSFALFQLIVLELMPHTGQTVPFIGLYFLVSMLLVGMSVFMTVVVLNIHFHGARGPRLPACMRAGLLHPLAWLFRVDEGPCLPTRRTSGGTMRKVSTHRRSSRRQVHSRPTIYNHVSTPLHANQNGSGGREHNGSTGHRSPRAWSAVTNTTDGESTAGEPTDNGAEIVVALGRVADRLAAVEGYLEDNHETVVSEWVIFAVVLDRLFATIYIVFLLISTVVLSIKYIYLSEIPEA